MAGRQAGSRRQHAAADAAASGSERSTAELYTVAPTNERCAVQREDDLTYLDGWSADVAEARPAESTFFYEPGKTY